MRTQICTLALVSLAACGSLATAPASDPNGSTASTSTGGGSTGGSTGGNADTSTFTGPQINYIGHVGPGAGAARVLAWGATGVAVRATGPSLSVNMSSAASNQNNLVQVFVDGVATQTITLVSGKTTYAITGLDSAEHDVRVMKRTEAGLGVVNFSGFTGKLSANTRTPSGRYIEFIGDSITAGYGNESTTGPSCSFPSNLVTDPNLENGVKAYGPVAADLLGAEVAVEAWSGKGLLVNRDSSDPNTMPDLYLLSDPTTMGTTYARDPAKAPQVVVVNLGTNDFVKANAAAGLVTQASFTKAAVAFLQALRAQNPSAYIIFAIGPMQTDNVTLSIGKQLTVTRAAVTAAVQAMADPKISTIEFTPNTTADLGCDYHPNVAKAAAMAAQLATAVKALTGWN